MEVFEDEHERPLLGCRLEQPPPGGERLLALRTLRALEADEGTRMAGEPLPLPLVLRERLDHRGELLLRRRRIVGLEDPGVRLDDLAERPEAHALAVGEGAALAP